MSVNAWLFGQPKLANRLALTGNFEVAYSPAVDGHGLPVAVKLSTLACSERADATVAAAIGLVNLLGVVVPVARKLLAFSAAAATRVDGRAVGQV